MFTVIGMATDGSNSVTLDTIMIAINPNVLRIFTHLRKVQDLLRILSKTI